MYFMPKSSYIRQLEEINKYPKKYKDIALNILSSLQEDCLSNGCSGYFWEDKDLYYKIAEYPRNKEKIKKVIESFSYFSLNLGLSIKRERYRKSIIDIQNINGDGI